MKKMFMYQEVTAVAISTEGGKVDTQIIGTALFENTASLKTIVSHFEEQAPEGKTVVITEKKVIKETREFNLKDLISISKKVSDEEMVEGE